MRDYKNPFVKKVAFYTQKVLPLVFDNSLSYYEALGHFCHKLNEVITAVNNNSMAIIEFEKELALALDLFEKDLLARQEEFETSITTAFNDFKTLILAEWAAYKTELESDLEEFKTTVNGALASFENEIREFTDDISAQQAAFESEMTQRQATFISNITTQQNNFESTITTQQNNFETAQTTRQNNFETAITTQQNDFETEVREELADFSSLDFESYFGSYSPIQTDPPTINSIGSNPLDASDMMVRLYYKAADSGTIRYIDRVSYDRLMLDYATICEAWASNSQCFWAVFENPAAWEWFKDSITPYGEAAINFSGDHPRLSVYCFDQITNNQITLSDGVHLASYTLPNGVIDIQTAMTTVEEHYSYSVGTYQYLALGFYAGLKPGCIKTVTQPANAKTKVYPSYCYSAFNGGIVRDPELINLMSRPDIFSTGTAIPLNADLDTYTTAGVYYCNSSQTVGTITNKPAAVTAAFKLLVIPTTASNRYAQIIIDNTATGSIYVRKTTTAGLSSWFSLNVTAAT